LTTQSRKHGPEVWIFRWRETLPDGRRAQRKKLVGTVEDFPTESAAQRAVSALRRLINQEGPLRQALTVETIVSHYRQKELPPDTHEEKAYATKECYSSVLSNWILPRWKSYRLEAVRTIAVEDWLRQIPRSKGTKAKIRGVLHALFTDAMRYEWLGRNPITLVRQSAKRERLPDVLDIGELQALLAELGQMERTLVLIDAGTGLRVGELLALKWKDVNFETLVVSVTRSIFHQVVGQCKTEASRKPVPLDSYMAEDLWRWKKITPYKEPEDWIFASPRMSGAQPYWPDSLLRRHIRTAAGRAGITKRIGWHTFRHTFSTLLKANGEDVKVVQELLRHANPRTTLETYTQAISHAKRKAQRKVVRMILKGAGSGARPA